MNHKVLKKYNIPNDAVITVAGTVGVGKSTFTKIIAEALGFGTSFESVDDNPYLEKYYSDFERWSFHLQMYFLTSRHIEHMKIHEYGGGFIQDRSIYEDYIFATLNHEAGTMTSEDFKVYNDLFNSMISSVYFPQPDLVVYIEGDFDEIMARIQERGRQMELDTPIEYWKKLYEKYTKWIESFYRVPILRINIKDYDLKNNEDSVDFILRRMAKVLNTPKVNKNKNVKN